MNSCKTKLLVLPLVLIISSSEPRPRTLRKSSPKTCHATTKSSQTSSQKVLKTITIKNLEEAFGKKPDVVVAEQVARITIPRDDVAISMDGVPLAPFMGLTTLISFQPGSRSEVELMGMADIVLLEDEVHGAVASALENGMNITALHNHFVGETPRFYFMHIDKEGTENDVIQSFKRVAATTKQKIQTAPRTETVSAIHPAPLKIILGEPAEVKNGMCKFVFGREFKAKCHCTVGKGMGAASWAAFSGTDDNALMTGDFALLEKEVQPLLQSLAKNKIKILAVHNHLLEEEPRYISVHFAGQGKAIDLAAAFNTGLYQTGIVR